nr:sugar phosphate isomerase/epimerase family protein [Kineosporia rhizophila]
MKVSWLELRCPPEGPYTPAMPRTDRDRLRQDLRDRGISLLSLATGVRLGEAHSTGPVMDELIGHLELAGDLGAHHVRIFPGLPAAPAPFDRVPAPAGDRRRDEATAAECLARAARVAGDLGVRVVLETHDSHPRGTDLRRIIDLVDPALFAQGGGVIWDLLHPWRVGETPPETWQALGPVLRAGHGYVQIKDVASPRDLTPVLQGTGAVPLTEAAHLLGAGGYRGPLSLEWERTWYPHVAPLSQALAAAVAAVRELPFPEEVR